MKIAPALASRRLIYRSLFIGGCFEISTESFDNATGYIYAHYQTFYITFLFPFSIEGLLKPSRNPIIAQYIYIYIQTPARH